MAGTKIFVGSLPSGSKPEELRRLFENYGVVIECDIMNRCGFVHMETIDMADNAIKALHDTQFRGQNIVVEAGRTKEKKKGNVSSTPSSNRGRILEVSMSHGSRGGGGRGSSIIGRGGGGRGGFGASAPRNRDFGRNNNFPERNDGVGPTRHENFRGRQRSTPYSSNRPGGKYNSAGAGFNNTVYPSSTHYDNWQGQRSDYNGSNRNFNTNNSYGKGGFGGGNTNQTTTSGMGGQDRRGFALPGSIQQSLGQARFSAVSENSAEAGIFPRRNNPSYTGRGVGGRGSGTTFGNPSRGTGRGFDNGRGRGVFGGSGRGVIHNTGFQRGGFMDGGNNRNSMATKNNYHDEFPALGSAPRGSFNRNAPRQNMMTNRRY